jgi:hypothetical protein
VNFYDEDTESLTYGMIDVVFAEMALLAAYIKKQNKFLERKSYLLSAEPAIDSCVNEAGLISQWSQIHNLSLNLDEFNVHPAESRLK